MCCLSWILCTLQEEKLDGDNRYFCESCQSKQSATRRIRLHSLPPTLNLQLMRFVFDRQVAPCYWRNAGWLWCFFCLQRKKSIQMHSVWGLGSISTIRFFFKLDLRWDRTGYINTVWCCVWQSVSSLKLPLSVSLLTFSEAADLPTNSQFSAYVFSLNGHLLLNLMKERGLFHTMLHLTLSDKNLVVDLMGSSSASFLGLLFSLISE